MASYFITDPAAADLAEIWDGHLERGGSEENAIKLIDRLFESFQSLAEFPDMGMPRDYLPKGNLALPHSPYVIIYRRSERGIDIVHVVYGGRDLPALFADAD